MKHFNCNPISLHYYQLENGMHKILWSLEDNEVFKTTKTPLQRFPISLTITDILSNIINVNNEHWSVMLTCLFYIVPTLVENYNFLYPSIIRTLIFFSRIHDTSCLWLMMGLFQLIKCQFDYTKVIHQWSLCPHK